LTKTEYDLEVDSEENMEALFIEAEQDYTDGKFQEAAEKYRMIIEAEPENAIAHQGLAQCLNRLGEFEEAAKECNRALELDTDLAIPYAVLGGSIYFRQRRHRESEAALRKAIALDPTCEEARISLGATLSRQGRLEEAVVALKEALELNPDRSIAHYNLGLVYGKQERYSDALREAFRAFQLGPSFQTAELTVLAAWACLKRHRGLLLTAWVICVLLPVLTRSLLALPLFALAAGFLFYGVILHFRAGRKTRGVILLLVGLAMTTLYVSILTRSS
jgi:tetratricopeptide (TPR) repeat protein